MFYECDPEKAAANLRKHKVSFAEAASVFLDPLALTFFDPTTRMRKIERLLLARLQNNGCCSFHIVSEETASA